jgi:hypothetical protein
LIPVNYSLSSKLERGTEFDKLKVLTIALFYFLAISKIFYPIVLVHTCKLLLCNKWRGEKSLID